MSRDGRRAYGGQFFQQSIQPLHPGPAAHAALAAVTHSVLLLKQFMQFESAACCGVVQRVETHRLLHAPGLLQRHMSRALKSAASLSAFVQQSCIESQQPEQPLRPIA